MLNKKVCPEILQFTLPRLGWNPRALTTTPDPSQQTSVCVSVLMCLCQPSWRVKALFLSRGVTKLEELDEHGQAAAQEIQIGQYWFADWQNFFPRYLEKGQISFLWDFQSLPRKSHSGTDVFKQQGGWDLQFPSFRKSYNFTKSEHWNLCLLFLFKIKIILNQTSRLQWVRKQINPQANKQADKQIKP